LSKKHGRDARNEKFRLGICRVAHDLESGIKKKAVESKQKQGAGKAPLFADHAKNEIGMMLGHKLKLALGPGQKALSKKPAGTDRDPRLDRGVSGTQGIQVRV